MPSRVSVERRRWVEQLLGARVVRTERLRGGITSLVHRLTVEGAGGARTSVVLRQWTEDTEEEPAALVTREAQVLDLLATTSVAAPRLLGADDGAGGEGVAALLMTGVAGRVELSPADPERWIGEMARTLAAIQQLGIDLPAYVPRERPPPDEVPLWAERPSVWRAALAAVQSAPPSSQPCFAHGDYQHFNLLWVRGRLRGVVDWVNATTSSPDLDVAHCRLNLTILGGVDLAEAFRRAYEGESGRTVDPWWDLHRLTAYGPEWQELIPRQVAGRIAVDVRGMTGRVEDALDAALRRL